MKRLLSVAALISAVASVATPAFADPTLKDLTTYNSCFQASKHYASVGADAVFAACKSADQYFDQRLHQESGESLETVRFLGAFCGLESGLSQITLGDVYSGKRQVQSSERGFRYVIANSSDHQLIERANNAITLADTVLSEY